MLARIRKAQEEREGGFTLIELLVVIIIIGILAAIAIPVFLNQRKKGYDARAKSDVRNVATLEETYLTDNSSYGTATQMNTASAIQTVSEGDTVYVYTTGATGFCLVGNNTNSTNFYTYDNAAGGLSGTASTTLLSAKGVCTAAGYSAAGTIARSGGTVTIT